MPASPKFPFSSAVFERCTDTNCISRNSNEFLWPSQDLGKDVLVDHGAREFEPNSPKSTDRIIGVRKVRMAWTSSTLLAITAGEQEMRLFYLSCRNRRGHHARVFPPRLVWLWKMTLRLFLHQRSFQDHHGKGFWEQVVLDAFFLFTDWKVFVRDGKWTHCVSSNFDGCVATWISQRIWGLLSHWFVLSQWKSTLFIFCGEQVQSKGSYEIW